MNLVCNRGRKADSWAVRNSVSLNEDVLKQVVGEIEGLRLRQGLLPGYGPRS